MHLATLHLAPILGAEKSKVPFYIAGGVLVAWALIVSVGLGRAPDFPRTASAQRAVIAISAVLVVIAAGVAVITSGGSTKAEASSSAPATSTSAPGAGGPPPASSAGSSTPAAPQTGSSKSASRKPNASTTPKATTGTPTPAAAAAAASTLKLAADPAGQLSYDTKHLSAKAGNVTVDFSDASPVEHNVVIAEGSKILGQTPIKTGSTTVTVALKPGTYTFYCAVPGHRQAGMEGTLVVS